MKFHLRNYPPLTHVILCLLQILCMSFLGNAQNLSLYDLRCEYLKNPIGIDIRKPRLSWKIQSGGYNVKQTSYQILVADSPELLQPNKANIWDSGKITSDQSIQVEFDGKTLEATQVYYWKVKIWDNQGRSSAWSEVATWQMGLFSAGDWRNAQWIAYERLADSLVNILPTDGQKDKVFKNNILPMFRKDFSVKKKVKRATVFISGLGHFELSLNGKKVGDNFLDAGWTKYDKQALYVGFDITKSLEEGKNTFGVMLGNGFYYIPPVKGRYRKLKGMFGLPKMICRLKVEFQDGSEQNLYSDNSWKTAPSPITFSSIYGGEDYNANLEQKGWDMPNFDESLWRNAIVVEGHTRLSPQLIEPVKIMESFQPIQQKQVTSGDWVFDLGQNASGIIELKVKGNKGDTVWVRPSELLNADGTVNQKASGSPYIFSYVLKGEGIETWQPRFSYYGFRYLQVKGAKPENNAKTQLISIKGLHIRNSASTIGQFASSDTLFNQTHQLIDWAIKSNMTSVFTDCPHREKLGWLEQVHLMGSSVRYRYDVAPMFKKAVKDMQLSQLPNGLIPEIAPEYVKFEWGGDMFRDSPEWGSSSIIVPYYMYLWYGDTRVLDEAYPMMQRYLKYLASKAQNHILSQGLGDWYDLGPKPPGVSQLTPMGVTGTAIYYYDLQIAEKIAKILGHGDDAQEYADIAEEVKKAFNQTFFNPETKQYASGSQTANAMALFMNLVEPENRKAVLQHLIDDIQDRNYALTAGDIGYRYVLRVLESEGRSDIIFAMNNRSDVPGYGYQLKKGATALTESWQAGGNSHNHFMLGHLMEWLYSGLAGIRQSERDVAFKEIIIAPEVVGNLIQAEGNYESPYGKISTLWKKTSKRFTLNVSVPVNTNAKILIDQHLGKTIKQNGKIIQAEKQGNKYLISVGSGNYLFELY